MLKSLGRITIFTIVTITLCAGLFLIALWSVDDAINYVPTLHTGTIDISTESAGSFLIFDIETGTEIASKDPTLLLPIASITKLFTAAVFYDTADLVATTSILWSDVNTDGDAGRLHPYEVYTYRELTYPLLLESSNDAAVAMFRVDPDLLEKMNAFAKDHGATQTRFADTSGLKGENVSTAFELSMLIKTLYKEQQHIFDITRLKQFIGTNTGWLNNNPLIYEEGYRGGKHGFTYEANRTAVAFFDEMLVTGQKRTIGYIILGSDDLKADISVLRQEIQKNVSFY